MATKAWRGEEVRRSTTFEDLQSIIGCSTRVAILVALSGGPMHVTDLRGALGIGQSLLSNHFKVLRESGIANYQGEGKQHFYHLLAPARITVADTDAGLTLHLTADDGSTLSGAVPKSSPVMRILARAVAASKLPRAPAPGAPEVEVVRRNGHAGKGMRKRTPAR